MEVNIRPLEEKDAYTSVEWRNTPEVWQYTGSSPDREITIKDELGWIKKVTEDKTGRRFAIIAEGVYVGNIYLTDIKNHQAEYHIFIGDKNYWGKGIARKASNQIIEYGKEVLGLKEIILKVNIDNTAAVKLYESLSFKEYGKNGKFIKMKLNL